MAADSIPSPPQELVPWNVVFTAKLGVEVNPAYLAEATGARLGRFPAAVGRMRRPRCGTTVFRSGSFQIVGTRCISDATLALYLTLHKMHQAQIFPFMYATSVCNILCSASLGYFLDIDKLHEDHPLNSMLSENFEGLHYIHERDFRGREGRKPKVTMFILFKTGKLVATGTTRLVDLQKAFEDMKKVLIKYKVDKCPVSRFKQWSTAQPPRKKRKKTQPEPLRMAAQQLNKEALLRLSDEGNPMAQ